MPRPKRTPAPAPPQPNHILPSVPPLTNDPSDPIFTLHIKSATQPPVYTPIQLRSKGALGPHLNAYCAAHGKRFRQDWDFVFWAPDPTPEDAGHEKGFVLQWAFSPAGLGMRDGVVIEVVCVINREREEGVGEGGGGVLGAGMRTRRRTEQEVGAENVRLMMENGRLKSENEGLKSEVLQLRGELADVRRGSGRPPPRGHTWAYERDGEMG